jgi:hypothetical protein
VDHTLILNQVIIFMEPHTTAVTLILMVVARVNQDLVEITHLANVKKV